MICKKHTGYILIGFTIIIAVCLSIFSDMEMGGESWGYWYFARIFAETGNFVVFDRSPLYTLYLNLFSWMPYPDSVIAEYLVTTSITVIALVAFFRRYHGVWLALLAACIWIPYLQMAEPPVQKLALASSLVAVLLRSDKADRFRLAASYAFLVLAYFFRQTYIILIVMFLAYDAIQTMRQSGISRWLTWRPKLKSDWPLLLVIGLFFWFLLFQSPSPWNNVQFTNAEWFPNDAKGMASGGAIQSFNIIYILLKYGTFKGHDFYFTNQEAFGGATSILGMLLANPHLVVEIIIHNLKILVPTIMAGIWIPKIGIIFIDYLFKLSLLIGIIYGAFRAARDGPTKILIVGSLFMVGVTVIATPNSRYMFPMIPVFIMATSWYGSIIVAFLKKLYPSDEKFVQRVAIAVFAVGILALFYYLIGGVHLDFKNTATNHLKTTVFLVGTVIALFCAFVLIIASRFAKGYLMIAMTRFAHAMPTILLVVLISASTMFSWARILHSAVVDVSSGHLHILEDRKTSMKASFPSLTPIFQDCHGIMSLEPTFFGAFLDMPQSKFFGVWEIPPFGKLGDTAYNGLTPDRIDCVFISNNMATNIGMASNHQIRYQNYIKPYVKQLQTMGAVTYDVPNGQVVVFRNP